MGTTDKRVDAYIAKSADFAKPILDHIRAVVHEACPDVAETMKWNFPHFMYRGMLCSMASFKEHCAFGFWNRQLVTGDPADAEGEAGAGRAMDRRRQAAKLEVHVTLRRKKQG